MFVVFTKNPFYSTQIEKLWISFIFSSKINVFWCFRLWFTIAKMIFQIFVIFKTKILMISNSNLQNCYFF